MKKLEATVHRHHPWDGVFLCGKQREMGGNGELIEEICFLEEGIGIE
ncbi:hypothetical protein [Rossellomorea marisflavi]|nr:hypothetical protein [Rossellomorea marisflavi]